MRPSPEAQAVIEELVEKGHPRLGRCVVCVPRPLSLPRVVPDVISEMAERQRRKASGE